MKFKQGAKITVPVLVLIAAIFTGAGVFAGGGTQEFTEEFLIERCTFSDRGNNPYFILIPGHRLVLEGEENKESVRVEITVLNETEMVNGVRTRVVEESEIKDGALVEISRNFFAICKETNSVFYFGEDVDIYEDGEIVSHEGAWRAGVNDARPGIIMPGTVLLGARYFNELAPEIAMDRAEIISMDEVVETSVGVFEGCLNILETTPLEPNAKGTKIYAPGVGLVVDGPVVLTDMTLP